jgi:hypothetical protein
MVGTTDARSSRRKTDYVDPGSVQQKGVRVVSSEINLDS